MMGATAPITPKYRWISTEVEEQIDGKTVVKIVQRLWQYENNKPLKELRSNDPVGLIRKRVKTIRRMIAQIATDAASVGLDYNFVLTEFRPVSVKAKQSGGVTGTGRITKPFRYFTGGLEKKEDVLHASANFAGVVYCALKMEQFQRNLEKVCTPRPACVPASNHLTAT